MGDLLLVATLTNIWLHYWTWCHLLLVRSRAQISSNSWVTAWIPPKTIILSL